MAELLRCPICGKSFDPESSRALPFCGPRCKKIDLARWLGEQYGLPYDREDPDESGDMDDPG